jgi:fimbrial chaperone protein
VFTLPAQGQQILRVALRRDADTTRELSYRLALQEVVAEAPKEFTGLRVALRLSLPIFVAPPDGGHADLQWSARVDASGVLAINAINQGNGHIQLSGFSVYLDSPDATFTNSGARYVLPGSHASWSFKTAGQPVAQSLTIRGYSDRGEFSAQVPIVLP